MRTVAEIEKELKVLEEELANVEGRPTEVYTRIVGYYRSLRNWNLGKREEYNHRTLFATTPANETKMADDTPKAIPAAQPDSEEPVRFSYFYRQSCPNCPAVKSLLDHVTIPGAEIDVDTEEGTRGAIAHNIYATPTVIFFDGRGEEICRATSVAEIRQKLPEALLRIPQPA